MSFLGLLNQTISIYPKGYYNAQGREVVGTAISVKSRVQIQRKIAFLPNNATLTIDAVAYVPPSTNVEIDYRVDYDGVKYKVHGKYKVIDDIGNVHHIKLELLKWRET